MPMATSEREPVIIAESPAMRRVLELARRLAPTGVPILLVGPTGTGKEVVAQAIHRWSGRPGRMVDLDCGSVPTSMLANQLFGHVRGAYTGATDASRGLIERADAGTLFLDELTGLSLRGQAALMRVLETGEVRRLGSVDKVQVDFRLIAAVQERVWEAMEMGRFRSDLFQRLSGWLIRLPALKDRREDLMPMAQHFAGLRGFTVDPRVYQILTAYSWPGNIRELRSVVERAVFLADTEGEIGPRGVAEAIDIGASSLPLQSSKPAAVASEDDAWLIRICEESGWDLNEAAQRLSVHRSTLYRRVQALGITREKLTNARLRARTQTGEHPVPQPDVIAS